MIQCRHAYKQTNVRDYYLDTLKGLLIVGIVLIHTVFHSGGSYVPNCIRNIVLGFDVPLFFFITGCVMATHPNINPLKQMYKLILIFFFGVLLTQICFLHISLPKLMQTVYLAGANVPLLKSINASYWFVPMYIVALIYAKIIVNYFKKWVSLIILIAVPVYYISMWIIDKTSTIYVLGLNVQSFLFYLWLILFGNEIYKFKGKKYWLIPLLIAITSTFCFYRFTSDLCMQSCKFPVKLPYIVLSMISISAAMLMYKKIRSNIFSKIGKNALYYYLSQGIGASIIYLIAKLPIHIWQLKFILCFCINLTITLLLGYIFSLIYPKFEKLFIKNEL